MKKSYEFTRVVPLSVERAYQLAADVEKYPAFIPSVKSARIISEEGNVKTVEIVFHHSMLSVRHVGRATFVENQQIEIRQIEGLGKNLLLTWKFEPAEASTKISLVLDFESDSRLLGHFAVHTIERITSEILRYFVETASK